MTETTALIDALLPRFDFRERHEIEVRAPAEVVLAAAEAYRPDEDAVFRRLIALRELPMRLWSRVTGRPAALPAPFGFDDFRPLGRVAEHEIVHGLIGRFWRSDYGLVPFADAEAFAAFRTAGVAKLVLGFAVEAGRPVDDGVRLVTETRVFCPDRETFLRFAPYWYLIRPVSGLLRRRMLVAVRHTAELSAPGPRSSPVVSATAPSLPAGRARRHHDGERP